MSTHRSYCTICVFFLTFCAYREIWTHRCRRPRPRRQSHCVLKQYLPWTPTVPAHLMLSMDHAPLYLRLMSSPKSRRSLWISMCVVQILCAFRHMLVQARLVRFLHMLSGVHTSVFSISRSTQLRPSLQGTYFPLMSTVVQCTPSHCDMCLFQRVKSLEHYAPETWSGF